MKIFKMRLPHILERVVRSGGVFSTNHITASALSDNSFLITYNYHNQSGSFIRHLDDLVRGTISFLMDRLLLDAGDLIETK